MPAAAAQSDMLLPLPDGRVLVRSTSAGRDQLAVLAPGKDAVPFLETEEPTTSPMSLVGKDRVAFLNIGAHRAGKSPSRLWSMAGFLRRLARPDAANVSALAGGRWMGRPSTMSNPASSGRCRAREGSHRKCMRAIKWPWTPTDQSLVIELTTRDAVRLCVCRSVGARRRRFRCRAVFGCSRISLQAPWHRTGELLSESVQKDSWFWPAAVLDPRSGGLIQLPGVGDLDMPKAAWGADGRLVSLAQPTRSSLWRFRQVIPSR